MLSVTLSQDLESRLKLLANQTGQSINEHLHKAVSQYFLDLEDDQQDLQEAMVSLQEVENGGATITLDELEKELGIKESK